MSFFHWLALTLVLGAGAARTTVEFTEDSLDVVKKNVAAKKAVLVDVRSREEWNEGHIEGSLFVPVTSLRKHSFDAKKLAKTLPKKTGKKEKQVILYTFCVVGMRAKAAAKVLDEQGYTVRALKPGYEELIEAGFKKGKSKQPAKSSAESPVEGHENTR